MKNILLLTFAISPRYGSEYAVGFNFVKEMCKKNNLFVIYADTIQNSGMDDLIKENSLQNVKFYCCGQTDFSLKRRNIFEDFYQTVKDHKRLQRAALNEAKKIIECENIDVIHVLNPIGFKEPSYLWTLGKPYIWGPVQAVSNWPFFSIKSLSKKGLLEFVVREFFQNLFFLCSKRVKCAFKRANIVISANTESKRQIEKVFKIKTYVRSENAILTIENQTPMTYDGGVLKIVFAGSLIDRKGHIFFLKALKKIKECGLHKRVHLDIVGDGYLKNSLQHYCKSNQLDDCVTFWGAVSRDVVQKILMKSHLNVMLGLAEGTPTMLWECLAKGLPSLSFKHWGMKDVLTDDSCFFIDVNNYNQVVDDIKQSIITIIENPDVIEVKSRASISLAHQYTWDHQINFFDKCYNEAIKQFEGRHEN